MKYLLGFGIVAAIFAIALNSPNAAAESRPPMFVLQVGISKYLNAPKWAQLSGPVNDVVKMREVLEGERYRVPSANIVTLIDAQGTKATIFDKYRNHLIAKVRDYFEKTKKRDAVALFQFSGHGSQVPDIDGDEKDDHLDETLVTYDSQDVKGKNFDITDDEIFALTGELKQYTDNIVYILDTCHSGSGTRDAAEQVRRLPVRNTVPEPVGGVGVSNLTRGDKADDDSNGGMLPPGVDYIVISAAAPDETAKEKQCFEECGATERPVVYGYLTYYLVDELKNARSDTSYRELMENVTRRVSSDKLTQTPQLEGDKRRFVFGGLGSTEDNYVRIAEVGAKQANGLKTVKIKAGALQGVSAGTIVSFYDGKETRFDTAEKISSGTVSVVTPGESTVQIVSAPRDLTLDDKAVIVAPDLASSRLKVNLEVDTAKFTPNDTQVISKIRKSLNPLAPQTREPRGVDIVNTRATDVKATRWDVAVLKDKFSNVAAKMPASSDPSFYCHNPEIAESDSDYKQANLAASRSLKPDRDVFYLAGKDFVPLYRFCVETSFADQASRDRAASRIESALVQLVRLKAINSISNAQSGLKGKVTVRPVRLIGPYSCENGKFKAERYESIAINETTGRYYSVPGEVYWFEITNRSPRDLYLTLLNLGSDGSVKLYSPRTVFEEKDGVTVAKNGGTRVLMSESCRVDEKGNFTEAGPFRSAGPSGLDKFKVIATVDRTTRDDFAYLEMPSMTRKGSTSALVGASDWTTVDVIFNIVEGKK
ncbi:hypothetical protein BH10ACI2_BH10ACI2_08590 [soil metagenome]